MQKKWSSSAMRQIFISILISIVFITNPANSESPATKNQAKDQQLEIFENYIDKTFGAGFKITKDNTLAEDTILLVNEKLDTWTVFQWVNIEKVELKHDQSCDITTEYIYNWAENNWNVVKQRISYFDENIRKDSIIELSLGEQGWQPSGRTYFYYNNHSDPIEETHEWIIECKTINDYRISYKFDNSNHLIEQITQVWRENIENWENSTKFTMTYGDNNLVDQKNAYVWKNNDWSEPTRTKYTYNSENLLIEYTEAHLNGFTWQNISAAGFTYNENELLTESIFKKWVDSQWQNEYKHEYKYENNLIISDMRSDWITSLSDWRQTNEKVFDRTNEDFDLVTMEHKYIPVDWQKKQQKRYFYNDNATIKELYLDIFSENDYNHGAKKFFTYDEQQQLIEIVEENYSDNSWLNVEKEVFEYDNSNRLIRDKYYSWKNNDWVPKRMSEFTYTNDGFKDTETIKLYQISQWNTAGKITFEYNEENLLVLRTVYLFQGGEFVANSRAIITYTGFNEPETESLQLFYNNQWYDYSIKYHSFDAQNLLIQTKWDYWNYDLNDWKTIYLDTYSYNNDNLLSVFLEQYYDNKGLVNIQVTYYNYNPLSSAEFILVNDNKTIIISPHPVVNISEISFPEINNEQAKLKIINLSGEIVKSIDITLQNRTFLDVRDLPSGIYTMQIITEKQIMIKQFIVSKK